MPKRVRWLLVFGLLGCLALAGVLHQLLPAPSGSTINRENYEKLQPGMNRTEIEIILSGKGGDYTGGRYQVIISQSHPLPLEELPMFNTVWIGPECAVEVTFTVEGRATSCRLWEVAPRSGTAMERARSWLRL